MSLPRLRGATRIGGAGRHVDALICQAVVAELLAGLIDAHLRVSSTASDTDFVARVVDLWPDGRAIYIQ